MRKLNMRLIRVILHTKGQFVSVAVIVATALCIYVLFSMLNINIETAVATYYQDYAMEDILVKVLRMPESAVEQLQSIEGVKQVQGRVVMEVPLDTGEAEKRIKVRFISVPPEGNAINKLYAVEEDALKLDETHIAILQQFADARKIKVGDVVQPIINGTIHDLTVASVVASPEFIYLMENDQALITDPADFGIFYVEEEFAQSYLGYSKSYNEVVLTLDGTVGIADVKKKLESKLSKYGIQWIVERKDQVSNNLLQQKMEGIKLMSGMLPVMFLVVAAIVIVLMLSRTVANDRIAIGVLKAMGYTNTTILMHYVQYALMIGLCGSIVGITGGQLLSGPMSRLFIFFFNVPIVTIQFLPGYMFTALILASLFCIGSGLIGARFALHVEPAESMRPEAPRIGTHMLLEKWRFFWQHTSTGWRMVFRNVSRSKRRFFFLALGLSMAYAINTVPLYETLALPAMFELQYGEYQHMDYIVGFKKPMSEKVLKEFAEVAEIKRIEPRIEYPYELVNAWHNKRVLIIGVPKNTELHSFQDMEGHSVELSENGIFLTTELAKLLHVEAGDTLTIRNFMPGRDDVELKVSGIIRQYLGINAYMDIGTMQRLLTEKDMVTGAGVISDDDVKGKLETVDMVSFVQSMEDLENQFLEYTDMMKLAIQFYMLFGGILGFAIIYNSSIISISERRLEFAALRIMGYSKNEIFSIISRENLLVTILAVILGIPLGLFFINGIIESFSSELVTFPRIIEVSIFIKATLGILFFVVIAQMATHHKIGKLQFIEALKNRIS